MDKIKSAILDTLHEVRRNGFPEERIEAIMQQQEFGRKHVTEAFGLNVAQTAGFFWTHNMDIIRCMSEEVILKELEQDIAAGGYFEGLVDRLIRNQHRLTLVMKPDKSFTQRQEDQEKQQVEAISASLSETHKEDIMQLWRALRQRMLEASMGNADVLPGLTVQDISPDIIPLDGLKLSAAQSSDTGGVQSLTPLDEDGTSAGSLSKALLNAGNERDIELALASPAAPTALYALEQPTNGIAYVRGRANQATTGQFAYCMLLFYLQLC